MSDNLELPGQFPAPPRPTKLERLIMQGVRPLPPPPNYPPPAPPARPTPRRLSPAISQERIYWPYVTPPETVITPTSDTESTMPTSVKSAAPLASASATSARAANTTEMLRAVSGNTNPPPDVLEYFHDLLENTFHRALLFTAPPTTDNIHQDHAESLAEVYSVMAGLGTSLTFLYEISENIRDREMQYIEQKKRRMKELDRSRVIVRKNVKDAIAYIPHN
ncbi:hypothetical protein IW261DRAFT_1420045 [Armillaria novae-zelandiae]|uniref:Uncharacterized protein n=1 Tax=Armillaria novae-zelandiae TaxID=153914 RepID=A0AA39U7P7_9AGAR|nr:hypothetical protein IW261DRAFT_1420045 [Armillaria novae-zelandiae]